MDTPPLGMQRLAATGRDKIATEETNLPQEEQSCYRNE